MIDPDALDWAKSDGLIPAIVQHHSTGRLLMLGYMNREAFRKTVETGRVTFFSRSRQRLWTKGETSGNFLTLIEMSADCDGDSLLLQVQPHGPTCHLGADSCFAPAPAPAAGFLSRLELIQAERTSAGGRDSYTARLSAAGVKRIAQKVGEEAVETALAAVAGNSVELTEEAADLMYHLLLLLRAGGSSLSAVIEELERRRDACGADGSD